MGIVFYYSVEYLSTTCLFKEYSSSHKNILIRFNLYKCLGILDSL